MILVCTWRLLGMIRSDRIFTETALRWVEGTLEAICRVLECQPGNVLEFVPEDVAAQ